jgi:dihydropteroate synthase
LLKRYYWKLKDREVALGEAPLVGGWIPVTSEPAPDGERYLDPDRAYARALQLEGAGADFVELSGEMLRPGGAKVDEEEQIRRIVPVLKRLRGKLTIPISVCTVRAKVVERAAEYGALIVRDPSGLVFDPDLVKAANEASLGLVLGHVRGTPDTWAKQAPAPDPAGACVNELIAAVHRAVRGNIERARLVVDPGLGLGKRRDENAAVLAGLNRLRRLDLPVSVTLAASLGLTSNEAGGHSVAIVSAVLGAAYILSVFDVAGAIPLVQAAFSVFSANLEPDLEIPQRSRR